MRHLMGVVNMMGDTSLTTVYRHYFNFGLNSSMGGET
jgi:hypothetical protein